jgi:glycosyltransferase involved in cell wall biosynthesis
VRLFSPVALRDESLRGVEWADCRTPSLPPRSMRAYRAALPSLVREAGVRVFLSPWSAFPRLTVPVVVTVHEIPFVRWGPIEGRVRAWVHRRWLARDVAEAAAILVPSKATAEDVVRLHPAVRERVAVVPHGFDPEPWERAGASGASAEPYGLLVGTTSRRKGIDVFLDALPRVADLGLRWVLAGPSDRDAARALSRAARKDPSVETVHPREEELRRLVAGARLLVFPSRSEGFGFPPLEAMAAGVPVVSTTAGSIPEVVDGAAHLVRPGDADALASGIRAVATDDALRGRLVDAGRARARAFPCAGAARATLDVLERVGA